jgi:peptide/nickel transport system substrate-binding protein
MTQQTGPFRALYEELKAGRISRRDFLSRAAMLGVGAPVALFVVNSVNPSGVAAQAAGAPSAGTEGQTRGAGGELKMLQWQAATHMGLHTSTGTKDSLAASLITEPLLSYLPDGTLIPTLAAEVPSIENGGVSEDLTTVTYKLKEGVLWNDGQPFSADDVVFTWQWITDPANSSINISTYQLISSVEAVDPLTAKVTFAQPQITWFVPFVNSYVGSIYPKHVLEGGGEDAYRAFVQAPVGTGPYKVESFTENDQVVYVMNENYREPNKPFFERVNLKGGGDAVSAAQAVLQTGDWDFAWNLQVERQILEQLVANGKGTVQASPATNVERILINFSDPDDDSMGERSHKDVPHPMWSDLKVRQALAFATDRDTLSNQFYAGGDLEPGAKNILTGLAAAESPNTSYEFNLEKAAALLDEAGWVLDGDTRKKDGKEFTISYSTSINAVRQKTQALNKQNWESIGIKVNLKQVDPGIFFDSAAGNEQNAQHFYEDLLMYTNGPSSSLPISYMQSWYAGPDGENLSQKANNWSGVNESRYANADYDAMYEQLTAATDLETANGLLIAMNDHLINDQVIVPEVARAAEKYAILNTLNNDNIAANAFEALYWNIANWNRVA